MEKGEILDVFYKDDERVRKKTLEYVKENSNFIEFKNTLTGKKDILPVSRIVRIEGAKENENSNIGEIGA